MNNKESTIRVLHSLGMRQVAVQSIDEFEGYLLDRQKAIHEFENMGMIADTIITILNSEGDKVISDSVRYIRIDTETGYGFIVNHCDNITRFTYHDGYTVFSKSHLYE